MEEEERLCLTPFEKNLEVWRQLWRVLAPEGRILLIAPNRNSLWAQVDRSPFGHGRPFSRNELDGILKGALFHPSRWERGLYAPPMSSLTGSGASWEAFGARMFPGMGGVHVVEATKSLYAAAAPPGLPQTAKAKLKTATDFNFSSEEKWRPAQTGWGPCNCRSAAPD